ncbi:MAG TPA: tRNA pseudouridine(55) synthase TruB [Actinobacteria bacterium]|nr:tRNA pseudouridine(55) synthase TruB [Actinomycetes bacterium]HEX21166.1 tRNA pseudouridine(55) synthase TruB [Actinomycetota bacterium]
MINGLLLIDKPAGPTSHDVVDELRRILGQRRVGHTGTLDPMATGLLVMMLGQATRLSQYLESDEKEYEGTIRLGITTDTLDAQGKILERRSCRLNIAKIKNEAAGFVGKIKQVPPMVSAVRVDGRRLHQLARAGKKVERAARDIEIKSFDILTPDNISMPTQVDFHVSCSKGTYIRVLAAELGERLGCGAHLSRLKRVKSGHFHLSRALDLHKVESLHKAGLLKQKIISPRAALPDWAELIVDAVGYRYIGDGCSLLTSHILSLDKPVLTTERVKIIGNDGKLICLAEALMDLDNKTKFHKLPVVSEIARPVKVFL